MKISLIEFSPTLITGPADDMNSATPARSSGLHLSQIYGSIVTELELAKPESARRNTGIPIPVLETYRAAGFIWERAFERAMADGLASEDWQRPGEFARDGISCSPDLIGVRDWVLGEIKFTWKSSRHLTEFIESGSGVLWVWGVQMKGYCHVVGTNRARLFAYFVNGDYRNMQPQFHVCDIEFTPRELRDNWSMLLAHARSKKWL